MRNITTILLITFSLVLFGCQNALGPQLQDNSKVKTETKWRVSSVNDSKIAKISYKEFNKNGDILSEISFNQNGDLQSTSEFSFKDGIRTEREVTYSNGDTIGVLTFKYELQDGRVTKKTTLDNFGVVIKSEELLYDINGNVKERLVYTNGENNGQIIKYDNNYTNGSLTSRYTLETDGTISQKDSIIYNNNKNIFEKITSDNLGNIFFSTSYTIDDNGNIKSEIIKDSKGAIVEKYIYEFTYFD